MKPTRWHWMLMLVALAMPAVAVAQHGHAPSPAPAPAEDPAWQDDGGDDDSFAFLDEGDELFFMGDEGDEGPGMTWVQKGPGGSREVVREMVRTPGRAMRDMRFMGRRGAGMGHAGMGPGRMGRGGMGMHRRFAQLDLTDAQREKLRDLHEAAMRKAVQRRADLQLARMDLHKLLRADKQDPTAVNAQIDKLARMHAENMKAHFETMRQAKALLTPEQLKQFKEGPKPRPMRMRMMDGEEAPKR